MVITHNNIVTNTIAKNENTIPYFNSVFPYGAADTDTNTIKYLLASSIFNIIVNTPLPNSNLCLRHDLVVLSEITKDGYVMKSSYIDEESFGSTLEEAYLDFLTSIRDKYASLQRREVKLSPRDKAVLANIRSLLK